MRATITRMAKPELLEIGNAYLAFIRNNPPFGTADALLDAYHREAATALATPACSAIGGGALLALTDRAGAT